MIDGDLSAASRLRVVMPWSALLMVALPDSSSASDGLARRLVRVVAVFGRASALSAEGPVEPAREAARRSRRAAAVLGRAACSLLLLRPVLLLVVFRH